ncbi:hypothetical protein [Treponema zioleckii]|uniref:hypothetical protein n=1 Tax=Treponema zioleckii TaxID=331680 RepID=UPI00168C03CF|nr:hypothetical protein [Treponema zioleckii]
MTNIADFIKIQKKDIHNHLLLGMRYPSYVLWAGFYIPEVSEAENESISNHRQKIIDYTHMRITSKKDVQNLFALSIIEALADNVETLEGTVNINLAEKCGSPSEFALTINSLLEKYSDQITIKPVLGVNTDSETKFFLAETFIERGLFHGLDIFGKDVIKNPEKYNNLLSFAKSYNLETKIHIEADSTPDEILKMLDVLFPSQIINADPLAKSDELLKFLSDNDLKVIISPTRMGATDNSIEEKAKTLRVFCEKGIRSYISTGNILLHDKSISAFASDLCNTNIFSKDEMIEIITRA